MRHVVLCFPDVNIMARFIIDQEVNQAVINSLNLTVEATIPDLLVSVACTRYSAQLIVPDNPTFIEVSG